MGASLRGLPGRCGFRRDFATGNLPSFSSLIHVVALEIFFTSKGQVALLKAQL